MKAPVFIFLRGAGLSSSDGSASNGEEANDSSIVSCGLLSSLPVLPLMLLLRLLLRLTVQITPLGVAAPSSTRLCVGSRRTGASSDWAPTSSRQAQCAMYAEGGVRRFPFLNMA